MNFCYRHQTYLISFSSLIQLYFNGTFFSLASNVIVEGAQHILASSLRPAFRSVMSYAYLFKCAARASRRVGGACQTLVLPPASAARRCVRRERTPLRARAC